jgi:hypothetical protein
MLSASLYRFAFLSDAVGPAATGVDAAFESDWAGNAEWSKTIPPANEIRHSATTARFLARPPDRAPLGKDPYGGPAGGICCQD